mgnify:CR=1 FL=1
MALTKPSLYPMAAFDATKPQQFKFYSQGGSQVTGNILTIKNNATLAQVYKETVTSFAYIHTLPADTLTNGTRYQATIQTIDAQGNISVESDPILFYCYTQPTLAFTNLPPSNNIPNASFEFEAQYNQAQSEQLAQYQFNLYDAQGDLVATSGVKYIQNQGVPTALVYTFSGFEDGLTYQIEVVGQTVEGTAIDSGKQRIYIVYYSPRVYTTIYLTNNCHDGYVTIENNLVGIPGDSNPYPPTYIDNKEVDLRADGSWVEWTKNYEISGDYTMGIWGRDFNPNSIILTFTNEAGATVTLTYREEGEYVWVELAAIHPKWTHYYGIYSNKIVKPADTEYLFIWNRRINNVYDLKIENRGETV